MSLSIYYYSNELRVSKLEAVKCIFETMEINHARYVSISKGESKEWEEYIEQINQNTEHLIIKPNNNFISIGHDQTLDSIFNFPQSDEQCLTILLSSDAFTEKINASINEHISEETRGLYYPWDVHLSLGMHDIINNVFEVEEVTLTARAAISISIGCSFWPDDPIPYSEQIFDVPAMKKFQNKLEEKLGPLETACIG